MPLPKDSLFRVVSMTMLKSLAKELDSYAFLHGKSRSQVISEAVKRYLNSRSD